VTYGNGLFVAVGDRRHHPHLPGRGELDGADLGDERLAQRRDLRERPLRGGGGRRHHPHLPGRGDLDGRTSGTSKWLNGVTYGNGLFVAVGEGGTILTSPDGVTWTQRTSGTGMALRRDLRERPLRGGGGSLGRHHPHLPGRGDLDGRTSGTGYWLDGVTYGNGLFVAVGDGGTILTSPDGVNWTQRTSGTGNWLFGVTYGNGLFVAVGD
jgi:hypothetical protein